MTQENIDATLEDAVAKGCDLIFTTTPVMVQASVKAAIANPKVRILNCSVNTMHRYIRTYYSRMHEAKFLMGAIAGAMAEITGSPILQIIRFTGLLPISMRLRLAHR